jgi:hypothetical protein
MKLRLQMDLGNAAFDREDGPAMPEVNRILLDLARNTEFTPGSNGKLYDLNGNHVGDWHVTSR